MDKRKQHTDLVKTTASALGFDFCGIAKAAYLEEDAIRLERWLKNDMHGKMGYMANHFDMRVDPRKLVPGAASVITLLINYYPAEKQNPEQPKIAKYAYGHDYHEIIRGKLNEFLAILREKIGEIQGRGFVDSAPVLERSWAQKSGLGWVGKNGNLINKQQGSFFFIASLITDLELLYDNPYTQDFCGTCTKCIDHCPTEAILPNKTINGSKCISYYTIELKDQLLPESQQHTFQDWMFGCDVCQDVCPWNRFSIPHEHPALNPIPELLEYSWTDWDTLTEETFKNIFRNSPIKRTKFQGIKRNLAFLKKDHE